MKNLSIIASVGKNRELGYQNDLIWKIKEDLCFFKKTTMGSHIIMGKNTFKSLPKELPGRKYIVLTRDSNLTTNDKIAVFRNIKSILEFLQKHNLKCYVIGGEQTYSLFLPYVDTMHLTEIDDSFEQADTFFPKFDKLEWYKKDSLPFEEKGISYNRVLYKRKNKS